MNPSSLSNLEQPLKRPIQRRPWTSLEDATLKNLIQTHGTNWKIIQQEMASRTMSQCQQRWKALKPDSEKKKKWTEAEDQQLRDLYKQYGNKWAVIGAHMTGRTDQQLRIRYVNILDPNIKNTKWTPEEDLLLYQLFIQYGPLWSLISKEFQNRSSNNIKNRFYTHTCKEYFSMPQAYQNNQEFGKWTSLLNEKRLEILNSIVQEENQQFNFQQHFENQKLNALMEFEHSSGTEEFHGIQQFESEIDQYLNLHYCADYNSQYTVNEYEL